ncbi:MAG: lipase family protein [Terracidiphilus sp.]
MQPTNQQVIFYLNFVNSAYLMYGKDGTDLTPPPLGFPPGYSVLCYLNTIDPDSGVRVFFGFIAANPAVSGPAILAIRGTYNYSEWFTDFNAFPTPFPPLPGSNVATGFYEFYQGLQWILPDKSAVDPLEFIQSNNQGIVLAGHSLGGAIATLMMASYMSAIPSLLLTLVTAASPAVGDYEFFTQFNTLVPNSYRYINDFDTVASFLDAVYYQVNTGIQLYSFDIWFTPVCEHSLQTYQYLLSPPGTPCNTDCCIVSVEQKAALQALHEKRRGRPA